MATSKPTKKTTTTKKPLPKAQFGGSGILGIPTFEERQKRKIDRAAAKNTKAQAQGYDSLADKRTERSNRISKVLGTARSKVKSVFGNNNNVANTVDSYNKGSYNKDSFNNTSSSSYAGRPDSIIESRPSGIQNNEVDFTMNLPKRYSQQRAYKKGGTVKKKTVAKKK